MKIVTAPANREPKMGGEMKRKSTIKREIVQKGPKLIKPTTKAVTLAKYILSDEAEGWTLDQARLVARCFLNAVESWHYCHDCQIERGGRVPKFGHMGITVTKGECRLCNKKDVTLIPNGDYDWPKEGIKAVWD